MVCYTQHNEAQSVPSPQGTAEWTEGLMSPVAIVTGAASGMGQLAARRLAARGWQVAAADLPGEALASVASTPGIHAFACDVSDSDQVDTTAREIEEHMGTVDRLVNAAGIAVAGRIEEVPVDRFEAAVSVNYLGTVYCVKAVLPAMRARDAGEIVLFASLAGWFATPEMGAYTATKFAVVGFAETLKLELRNSGVTLRCVCPPGVQTPMLDGIRAHPKMNRAADLLKPITAEQVLDAVDAALLRRRGDIFVFPGRGSTAAWRLRRFLPRVFEAGVVRLVPNQR